MEKTTTPYDKNRESYLCSKGDCETDNGEPETIGEMPKSEDGRPINGKRAYHHRYTLSLFSNGTSSQGKKIVY